MRFSYDELLLEKMIKIEHKTGVMIDNFSEISKQIKTDLKRVKGEFDKIQRDVKALSTEGHDTIENNKSRKENPQKPTQLSSRSHPRHLVGKRTAQKTPS